MADKIKTKVVGKRSGWDGRQIITEVVVDPPYTVFGSSVVPESYGVTMKVEGLRKMLKGLKGNDAFGITIYGGNRATEYSIIRNGKAKK